jgi:antitoxin component YwqK of YwqJK toxin-antitoxin module
MKKLFFSVVCLFVWVVNVGAQDSVISNGYNVFHYPSGNISSEGTMVNGQPNGYWKTYYENGVVKTEGNRLNFQLDSTWKFYDDSARLTLEINYREGKKNGLRRTFQKKERIEETFSNDVKQGWTRWFFSDSLLKKKVFFVDGREEGLATEYSRDGNIISISEYKKGYLLSTENINRSREGLKHGLWKTFFPDERVKTEATYSYGKLNGYFKEFDSNGNLLYIKKYANDVEIFDAPELASYEVRTDYYKNGKPKIVGSYKDGIAEGMRREYDEAGKVVRGYIFKAGIIVGEGIIDESGMRQGAWKEFFDGGELYGEGQYANNKKVGNWKYFYRDGKTEQLGNYTSAGKPDGTWKWFYESGNLKREEQMKNGLSDGMMQELSDSGKVIVKGNFIEGEEDGEWFYEVNDDKVLGSFVNGKKEGLWKHYYNDQLYFEGNYIEGLPDGEHIWYWDNGKVKEKGNYVAGKKEGNWVLNSYEGLRLLLLEYSDGVEIAIDGSTIDEAPEK